MVKRLIESEWVAIGAEMNDKRSQFIENSFFLANIKTSLICDIQLFRKSKAISQKLET